MQNHQDYNDILDHQKELICRFDEDTVLLYVNKAYCDFFRKSKRELIGTSFLKLIPEKLHEELRSHLEKVKKTGKTAKIQHQAFSRSGEVSWQSWEDMPIYDENGTFVCFQSVGKDIAEEKKMRDERALFEALAENCNELISLQNDAGEIQYANSLFRQKTSYSTQELNKISFFDLFSEEDKDKLKAVFRELYNGQETRKSCMVTLVPGDGQMAIKGNLTAVKIPHSESSSDLIQCSIRDMGNELNKQAKLELSNKMLRKTIDLVPHFIYAQNSKNEFLVANQATAAFLELSMEDLLANSTDAADRQKLNFLKIEEDCFLNYRKRQELSLKTITEKGEKRYFSVAKTAFEMPDSQEKALLVSAVEVTQHYQNIDLRAERSLFLDGPTIVFKWKLNDKWPILYVSPNIEKILGYQKQELEQTQTPFADLIHPEDLPKVRNEFEEMLRKSEDSRTYKAYRIKSKSGQYKWFIDNSSIVTDQNGKQHLYGYIVNITERVEAQKALAQKERQYRFLVSHMSDIVWSLDVESMKIDFVSPSIENVLGYSPKEHTGKSFDQLFIDPLGDAAAFFSERLSRFLAGDEDAVTHTADVQVPHKNGHAVWIQATTTLVESEGRIKMIGVSRNIDEQKKMEEQITKSELIFRQLTESIEQVFWLRSADKSSLKYISPAYEKLWGRSCHTLYANPNEYLDAIHPDDLSRFKKHLLENDRMNIECRIIQPSGEVKWVWIRTFPVEDKDQKGYIVGHAGVATDITQHKALQQQLLQSDQLLKKLTQNLPGAIYQLKLGKDGLISVPYASNGATNIFGFSIDEIKADFYKTVISKVHEDDIEPLLKDINKSANTLSLWRGSYRVLHKSGKEIWISGEAIPERDKEGNILWHGYIINVSAEKAYEQQLERLSNSKDRILATVAHDLRNPVSGIMGLSELLKVKLLVQYPHLGEQADMIFQAAKQVLNIIEELLQAAHSEQGNWILDKEQVNLNELITRVVNNFTLKASSEEIELECILPKHIVTAKVDAGKLMRVVQNLLTNAIKFTHRNGKVWVTLSDHLGHFQIEVKDTGIGIPEALQREIFEKFTKSARKGVKGENSHGLGMYIVKQIVHAHKGTVSLQSKEGKGTTIHIQILK